MSKTITNCGIRALGGMLEIKNVSMFTLINLARDNGFNFYFCKVQKDDIPLVVRPAILHSDNHFTLIENEQPIPEAEYTGWVLTPQPYGTPLPYSLAKQINGGKKVLEVLLEQFFHLLVPLLVDY